jgi:hypothetical protein
MYRCLSSVRGEEGVMEVGDNVGDMMHHDDTNCRGLTYYTTHINAEGFLTFSSVITYAILTQCYNQHVQLIYKLVCVV